MVVMPFTGDSIQKIVAGTKCATTRRPSTQWIRVVEQIVAGRRVDGHIYAGSPRNGGHLLYRARLIRGEICQGADYDPEMFLKDGFDDPTELAVRLWKHYGKGKADRKAATEWMRSQTWAWIEWGEPPAIEVRQEQLVQVPLLAL